MQIKRKSRYTIIELLVASGVFLLMMVLVLRFYHNSQSFMLRGTHMASHTAGQAFALNYLRTDFSQLSKSMYLDKVDPSDPSTWEEKILPITRESTTHYRFYSSSYDDKNQTGGRTQAISIRLVNNQLFRAVKTIRSSPNPADPTDLTHTYSLPLSSANWAAVEQNSFILAEDVEDFSLKLYKGTSWSGSNIIATPLPFSAKISSEHPDLVSISLSTARIIESNNASAQTASTDKTKQTIPFMIHIK